MTTAEMLRSYIQTGYGCDIKVNADLEKAACEIERLEAENRKLRDDLEDKADVASRALRRAWQLGQTYWQQADSEYTSQHRKSAETEAKYQTLVDETRAAIIAETKAQDGVP